MKHNNIPQLLMSTRGHTKNIFKFIMKILELPTVKPTLVTTSIELVKPALVTTSIELQSNLH